MTKTNELVVECCFCGQGLSFDSAVEIAIRVDKNSDEVQAVYSHKNCLDDRLIKSIPRILED
jgi:hypothetical protein